MLNKVTNVRFDINKINLADYMFIAKIIVQFIVSANEEFNILSSKVISKDLSNNLGKIKKLRKLQEEDPILYLHRDSNYPLYSVLCQEPKQPTIYNITEYNSLLKNKQNKLTEYYNFTNSEPAYFQCTNPEYPQFGFITNKHPKNYCLPCCRKKFIDSKNVGIMKDKYDKCIKNHIFDDIKQENIVSQHILNETQSIPYMRLRYLPSKFREIFKYSLYVFGVQQTIITKLESINISMFYIMKFILNVEHNIELCNIIENFIKKYDIKISQIFNGELVLYFHNINEFIDEFRNITINGTSNYSFNKWNDLFIEFFNRFFNIDVIIFRNFSNNEETIKYNNMNINRFIIIINDNVDDEIYYPIIYIPDLKDYFKLGNDENTLKKVFNMNTEYEHITILKSLLNLKFKHKTDIETIFEYVDEIVEYFYDKYGIVHSMILKLNNKFIYFPLSIKINIFENFISNNNNNNNNTIKSFGSLVENQYRLIDIDLFNLLDHLNTYSKNKIINYISFNGLIIGVNVQFNNNMMYYCYINNIINKLDNIPIDNINYNIYEANYNILHYEQEIMPSIYNSAMMGIYIRHIYKLFLIEYVFKLNNERNDDIRSQIMNNVQQYYSNKLKKISYHINSLLKYKQDQIKITTLIIDCHPTYSKFCKRLKNINLIVDKIQYFDMFDDSHNTIIEKLTEYTKDLVIITESININKMNNIYYSCIIDQNNQQYCDQNNKLLITKKHYDQSIYQLAIDIKNPLKQNNIIDDFTNIVNYGKFTKYPNEKILINSF